MSLLELLGAGDGRYNRAELSLREWPAWALILVGAGLVVGLGLSIAGLIRARRLRPSLVALRALSALLLLFLALAPALELQRATRIPSRVAVLVDVSRSMALGEGGKTRLERARAALGPALEALGRRFEVRLFTFADGLQPATRQDLEGIAALGPRTDLGAALAALRPEDEDGALMGIVLATDGVDTARLQDAGDVARRRAEWPRAPVFPWLAGDPAWLRDLALGGLRRDDFGFVRHEMTFDVDLSAHGFAGREARVTLSRDGAPLTTRVVRLAQPEQIERLHFTVRPDRPGVYLYALEVPPAEGESVLVNNRVEFLVTVARDQVRVLLICGRPSWDERFLRQSLKGDPNIDLVSFFILRDEEDSPGVPQDELSLIPFPVNDLFTTELKSFDVIILQDFNRHFSRTLSLTTTHLDNIRRFVVEDGGGLLLVGGDLGMRAGGYAGSPIEDVLPFALSGDGPATDEAPFQPLLTDAGLSHYVTSLEPTPEVTRELFAALPALDGTNLTGPLAASGAVALMVHPRLEAAGAPMPVLAARTVGKGRTLGLAMDTTWYWAFRTVGQGGTNREYLRFWQNALRWLAQDPSSKFLEIAAERGALEPDTEARLRVRALKGDYAPLAGGRIRARVTRASPAVPGTPPEAVAAEPAAGLTDPLGVFRFAATAAQEGFYRAEAELVDSAGRPIDRAERLYEVRADRTELADPGLDRGLLEAIAGATGGRLLEGKDLLDPPIPDREVFRLAERRRIELWDNWLVYGLLILALGAEWWLRRRAGLA